MSAQSAPARDPVARRAPARDPVARRAGGAEKTIRQGEVVPHYGSDRNPNREQVGQQVSRKPTRVRRPSSRVVLIPDFDPSARAGVGIFVAMVMALLVLGMIVLLLLNTALGQGAFELQNLQQQGQALSDQEQTLLQTVTENQSPQVLARRAAMLGMIPVTSPVFLRLRDGKILGTALPAVRPKPPASPQPATAKSAIATNPRATTATKTPTTPPATSIPTTSTTTRPSPPPNPPAIGHGVRRR